MLSIHRVRGLPGGLGLFGLPSIACDMTRVLADRAPCLAHWSLRDFITLATHGCPVNLQGSSLDRIRLRPANGSVYGPSIKPGVQWANNPLSPNSKGVHSKNFMESVEKILQCPVCHERLTPPIKLCKNEHFAVCEKCSKSLDRCPECGENLIIGKNGYFDNILKAMPVACRNVNHGCREIMMKEDMVKHEKICNYRLVKCFEPNCEETDVVCWKLYKHIKSKHYDRQISETFKFENTIYESATLENSKLPYYKTRTIYHESTSKPFVLKHGYDDANILYFCVEYIGKREFAVNYMYKVSFNQGQSSTFSAWSYCAPYSESYEEMKESPNVLSFDMNKRFFYDKPVSRLEIRFTIKENEIYYEGDEEKFTVDP